MATFNTIHIFGFGVVQVITKDKNIQTPISTVQAQADACIDNVWSKRPQGYAGAKEYHAINTFADMFSDWQSKNKGDENFRIPYAELDSALFETLALAVLATETPVDAPTN
jgi:hypothetical protein